MTIRDLQADFSNQGAGAPSTSIVGAAGTYVAGNSYDTSPLGAYLTELAAGDTQLSGNLNAGRDLGGGERIWLCIDWVTAPVGGTTIDMQLITSATSALGTPTVMLDFTALPTASFAAVQGGKGFRQIQALPRSANYLQWLGVQAITTGSYTAGAFIAFLAKDLDSVVQGYASGFSVK
jgi:hypothetical protein